jgi:hypothetical protein
MIDAIIYLGRVMLAAVCLMAVVTRCSLTALAFREGERDDAPNPLATLAYAYLLIATLLTFTSTK